MEITTNIALRFQNPSVKKKKKFNEDELVWNHLCIITTKERNIDSYFYVNLS